MRPSLDAKTVNGDVVIHIDDGAVPRRRPVVAAEALRSAHFGSKDADRFSPEAVVLQSETAPTQPRQNV
jgi:hypothetical protein